MQAPSLRRVRCYSDARFARWRSPCDEVPTQFRVPIDQTIPHSMKPKPAARITPPEAPKPPVDAAIPESLEDSEEYENLVFEGCDYADATVRAVHFRRVRFERVAFARATLPSAMFVDAAFATCDLAGARMERASLSRVELSGCRVIGARFPRLNADNVVARETSFELAEFASGRITSTRFERCDLRGATFREMDLRGVVFQGCNLRNADFRGCKLQGVDLRGSEIAGLGLAPESIRGVILDPFQASHLLTAWGATVLHEGE